MRFFIISSTILLQGVLAAQDVRVDFLYTIESPSGVTNFGRNVQVLDDVNGDTFPDFAIAASSPEGGEVFLFSGFNGTLLRSFESPQEAISIDSVLQDTFAISMALLPDVTGDNIAELIVGAPHHAVPGAQPSDFESGVVYVLNPTNFALIYTLTSPSPIRDGQFGRAVDGFRGNPNTQGSIRGIIIGAPGEAGVPNGLISNSFAGKAHVFDARTGSLLHTFINYTETQGEVATEGFFGFSVAAISNGGLELFVGEPGADFSTETFVNTGRIYKYQGFNQTALVANPLRIVTNAMVGTVMATAPNINRENGIGSGVVIGIPESFPEDNTQNFGRVELKDYQSFNSQNSEYLSPTPQTNSRFGGAVTGILDVNGDSRGDIVLGQPLIGSDPEGEVTDQAGFAHVYSAVNTSTPIVTLPRDTEPQTRGAFGSSMSGHRDSHAFQSRRRLLIGAPGSLFSQFPGGPQPRVYVYKMRTRLAGDLNNDRLINATDVTLLQSVVSGSVTVTQADILDVIDVNNDGVINSADLTALNIIINGPPPPSDAWVVK